MNKRTWLILVLCLAACATYRIEPIPSGALFAFGHSSSGPAPYGASVHVYPDGAGIYRNRRGKYSKFTLAQSDIRQLESLMRNEVLLGDFSRLTAKSRDYADYATVWLSLGETSYQYVCKEVSPTKAVAELVHQMNATFSNLDREAIVPQDCLQNPP